MLLDPALLTIGRRLRRLATLLATTVVPTCVMLPGTTVVPVSRFHVRRLQIGPAKAPTSSLVNTRVRGRRTIVRKNRHKRGPIITVRNLRR
jgi:hypothetical protein